MADRRIKDLTPVASLDVNFKVAVDKTGESEVGCVTVQQIVDLVAGIRRGSQALTVDTETAVTFASAFSAATYSLIVNALDTDGNTVTVSVTDRTTTGFNATAAANCTLNYLAVAI